MAEIEAFKQPSAIGTDLDGTLVGSDIQWNEEGEVTREGLIVAGQVNTWQNYLSAISPVLGDEFELPDRRAIRQAVIDSVKGDTRQTFAATGERMFHDRQEVLKLIDVEALNDLLPYYQDKGAKGLRFYPGAFELFQYAAEDETPVFAVTSGTDEQVYRNLFYCFDNDPLTEGQFSNLEEHLRSGIPAKEKMQMLQRRVQSFFGNYALSLSFTTASDSQLRKPQAELMGASLGKLIVENDLFAREDALTENLHFLGDQVVDGEFANVSGAHFNAVVHDGGFDDTERLRAQKPVRVGTLDNVVHEMFNRKSD